MFFKDLLNKHTVILASKSPRRQDFLRELGIPFAVKACDTEENYPSTLQNSDITDFIALEKANAIALTKPEELVISCDTIVWHQGKALGKPKDYDEAFAMLKKLSGRTHQVISSVCFKTLDRQLVFNETTEVTFSSISDAVIDHYIHSYKPFDKAGAYGIQEWIGLVAIEKIKGSYSNVVGLPTEKLIRNLVTFINA